jgi:hypothetical protein
MGGLIVWCRSRSLDPVSGTPVRAGSACSQCVLAGEASDSALEVAGSFRCAQVIDVLAQLVSERGAPTHLRLDSREPPRGTHYAGCPPTAKPRPDCSGRGSFRSASRYPNQPNQGVAVSLYLPLEKEYQTYFAAFRSPLASMDRSPSTVLKVLPARNHSASFLLSVPPVAAAA